jgi:hypothetical protein
MPAYTIGMLAPVPFLYAALKLQLRTLWLMAAGYGAVWFAAWVLIGVNNDDDSTTSSVAAVLFIALAAGGATHAFVLRQSLARTSGAAVGAEGPLLVARDVRPDDPAQITLAELHTALASLKSYIARHADRLPRSCNQLLDQTIACMEQVISFVATGGHADSELASVHAMLSDYLPTSIYTYVRLPRDYAVSHRNPDGRNAAEELELQLRLLRDSAKEAAESLYRGDGLRLQEQSVFLQSKFGTSELDLP